MRPTRSRGSQELGDVIAATFAEGVDVVLLENHGIVAGAEGLLGAFQRFETLDFCARTLIRARTVGEVRSLTDEDIALSRERGEKLPKFTPKSHTTAEPHTPQKDRGYRPSRLHDQRLMTSTEGTVSARVDADSFLITPFWVDRKYLDIDDIVLISRGRRERRKEPSRAVRFHLYLPRSSRDGAVITAQCPSATAYSITGRKLDTRTIPESYIVLRDIP